MIEFVNISVNNVKELLKEIIRNTVMEFNKTCPLCKQNFLSLVTYMSHIKSIHNKVSPDIITKDAAELKWSWTKND